MDKKEGCSTNFMPDDLLEIICILERGKKHYSYKIIRKRNYFSLITKPAKNEKSRPLVVVVVVYKFSQSRDTFSRSGLLKSNTSNAHHPVFTLKNAQ